MKSLYICNVFNSDRKRKYDITSDSPAAYNKVKDVSESINKANGEISILSISMGRSSSKFLFKSETYQSNFVDEIYLFSINIKFIKNLFSSLNLLFFLMRNNMKIKNVIFYNYQSEYFPSFIFLYLFKKNIVLDVEDGVNEELSKGQQAFRTFLLNFYLFLCDRKVLTVSHNLLTVIKPKIGEICYGAKDFKRVQNKKLSGKLKILFSGTLNKQTGVLLLPKLCELIHKKNHLQGKLELVVTGFGPLESELTELATKYNFMSFLGRVDRKKYIDLLESSNAGLVLKDPKTSMGDTTFPSKVVEYSVNGLSLICTKVSDLPIIYEESDVYFVDDAHDVVDAIEEMLDCTEEYYTKLSRQTTKSSLHFDRRAVGKRIVERFNFN